MKIGFVGLGKLGLPVAVAIAQRGFDVMGYDVNPDRMSKHPQPYKETGPHGTDDFNDHLAASTIRFGSMHEVAKHSDIIFVAVQTPHNQKYEGITPLPDERVDFDYTYLKDAVKSLVPHIKRKTVVAIISTCLPGTMRSEIVPLLNEHVRLIYNPSFIAMGTTMRDYFNPEFVLIGADRKPYGKNAAAKMVDFYSKVVPHAPCRCMSIESAELTKVLYNTFISFKIGYANIIMEICSKIELADVDDITDAIKSANVRLISRQYLSGGMGDGGGCHPRDNIAMSWFSRELGLKHDLFESLMLAREGQARWLAELLIDKAQQFRIPIAILGYAFKPETNITVGSHALLVESVLREHGHGAQLIDHKVTGDEGIALPVAVYLIGCKHEEYASVTFPSGSVVIDPFRYIPSQSGVQVIRLGECKQ